MIEIKKVSVDNYKIDLKNSRKKERPTMTDPGSPASLAIDIYRISVEDKSALLKTLSVGKTIRFKIDQDLLLTHPKKDIDMEHYANGWGEGEISSIENFDKNCEDDETQEITINLESGYAEEL
jgi:hypothetical protein